MYLFNSIIKLMKRENKNMTSNITTYSNQSSDKVLAILELISYSDEPLRLIDIANQLNFNTSTALRYLNTLEQNGYVYKDKETFKYRMTFKICDLASHVSKNNDLIVIASQPIKELSCKLGECVCLAIEQNYSVVYIYVSDGPGQILRTTQRIGKEAPMYCTGVGKMILSDYSPEKVDSIIAQKGLAPFTEYTLDTREKLLAELALIKKNDFAYDNQECELGARCIALPIRDYSSHIIASISVTGPISRMTDQFIQDNYPLIRKTADEISYQFGYQINH